MVEGGAGLFPLVVVLRNDGSLSLLIPLLLLLLLQGTSDKSSAASMTRRQKICGAFSTLFSHKIWHFKKPVFGSVVCTTVVCVSGEFFSHSDTGGRKTRGGSNPITPSKKCLVFLSLCMCVCVCVSCSKVFLPLRARRVM